MAESRDVFIGFTAVLFVVICLTRLIFLSSYSNVHPRLRWAGLYSWVVWYVWLVFVLVMVAAYAMFFSLFLVDVEQARVNRCYTAVCIFNIFFCCFEAQWPYLLVQYELGGGFLFTDAVENGLEIVALFPWSWSDEEGKWKVMYCVSASSACGISMLALFCSGAVDAGFTDKEWMIACSLAYMVFHLIFVDGLLWGVTWYLECYSVWKDGWLYMDTHDRLVRRSIVHGPYVFNPDPLSALHPTSDTCPRLPPLRSRPLPPSLVSGEGVL